LVAADAGYRAASNARWHVEVALLDLVPDQESDEKKKPSRVEAAPAAAVSPQPVSPPLNEAKAPPASAQVDQAVTPPEVVKASEPISANLTNLASPANEPISADLASPANEPISANLASSANEPISADLASSANEPISANLANLASPANEPISADLASSANEPISANLTNLASPANEPISANLANLAQSAAVPPRARRTAFSLKDLGLKPEPAVTESLASDQEEEVEVPHTERNLRPFTQRALDNAWKDAEQLFHDAPMVKSLIQTVLPVLEGDAVIRVSIENDLQQTLMLAERDRLVPFLRQVLQNDSIKLQTVVQEGSVNAKLVYTPDERFAFLLEKNPHLDDFRREFQLDIE
jgi:hypothetical protein